ncbi:trans-sialidase, putative, partial [Trypanosoma cruzi marinkellei]
MLVTLPVYVKKDDTGGNGKDELHLWLTDNTHIVDIGPVSSDKDVAASSLLYNSETKELIALYEKKEAGNKKPSPGMVSVLLTEKLQRVKDVLGTWKKADGIVSKLCPSNAEKGAPTTNVCSAGKVTAGLVGFLSGSFSDNTWMDEYLGVNATVHNDEAKKRQQRLTDGVKFQGSVGGVACWQAGGESAVPLCEPQLHSVATVSIHKMPEG